LHLVRSMCTSLVNHFLLKSLFLTSTSLVTWSSSYTQANLRIRFWGRKCKAEGSEKEEENENWWVCLMFLSSNIKFVKWYLCQWSLCLSGLKLFCWKMSGQRNTWRMPLISWSKGKIGFQDQMQFWRMPVRLCVSCLQKAIF